MEIASVLQNISFIKESQRYPEDFTPRHIFASAPWFFANWDAEFADRLIEEFRKILQRDDVGGLASAVHWLDAQGRAAASGAGLDLATVSLQQLVIRKTSGNDKEFDAAS